jgi:alpha-tubulin suppressor-like RCC1 family protein
MSRSPALCHAARIFSSSLLILVGSLAAYGADNFSGGQLSIPSLTIGAATYSGVVVTVGSLVTGPTDTTPYTRVDSYNPANNQLTVPVVTVGGATYYNVVANVTSLVSITGVSGADTYISGQLSIPTVLVGANVYTGVVTVGRIVQVAGGMPSFSEDSYNPASGELTIPAVRTGGKVYTNVTITVGSIVSASATPGVATPAVAAGQGHSCALGHTGLVWCWGDDVDGQLGNGGTTRSDTPVPVMGLPLGLPSGVIAVATGQYHSCALTRLGAVVCWGYDANGELGDGRVETQSSTPVAVIGLSSGVVAISAGGYDTCARTATGVDLCWGAASGSPVPVRPNGLNTTVVSVAAGSYTFCAVTSAGADLCWGTGALGNPNANSSITPYPVLDPAGTANLPTVAGFSVGYGITCARNSVGTALCWGNGPLGDGVTVMSTLPVQVLVSAGTPIADVAAIATGNQDACALTTGGGILCWGYNAWGQLGYGTNSDAYFATPVTGLSSGVTGISMGEDHTCAVTTTGAVWCWGLFGSLGNVSGNGSEVPSQVVGVGGSGFLQL